MGVNKNFVVKNGLEVNSNLILADAVSNRVGVGTTVPLYDFHVVGGIGATSSFITGFSTVITKFSVGPGGNTLTGIGGSIGIGTANPLYLLDVRSPVSTGQTALYVQGDVFITGDLTVDDINFDDATLSNLTITDYLYVGGTPGVSTFVGFTTFSNYVWINNGLNVTGFGATLASINVLGVSTFRNYGQFIDNTSLYFGDGADLNIYHDGSNSYIQEQGAGNLYVQSNGGSVSIRTNTTENAFVANQDGSVELYYDNSKKLETVSVGVTVYGNLEAQQLKVTGISTFQEPVLIQNNLNVSGFTTLASAGGITTTGGDLHVAGGFRVSGVTTLASAGGITTTGGDLYVGGDLYIADDLTFDSFTATNATVTGFTTLGTVTVKSGIITATSGIVTYYGDGSYLTGNARNLTATIGLRTEGSVVGYGVSFLDLRGPGVSTVFYNNTGIATIFFQGGSGSASIGIGTTPGEAFVGVVTAGNLWYNSNLGRLFIYYQDLDSSQWVDASPSNVGVITSLINVSFAPGSAVSPSMHFVGDQQTGFFSPGLGQFTVVSTGSSVLNINPSGINVTGIVTSTSVSTGNINSSGIVTAQDFDALSDINYKENINTVNNALLKVDQLRGVKFNWKESGLPSYGVIAQELEEVLPELVHGNDPKTVNYNGIIGVLIEAIKELKAEVEELKNAK